VLLPNGDSTKNTSRGDDSGGQKKKRNTGWETSSNTWHVYRSGPSQNYWTKSWMSGGTIIFTKFTSLKRPGACRQLADYYGITYERVDQELGIFWPCPSLDHPGTPRLFTDKMFYTHDRKAHFNVTEWRPSGDPVDEGYPLFLTTGRVVSQYLSGTQTRRIGALVDQIPEPLAEIHPRLAERHEIKDGDWVRVTTRRDELTVRAQVVKTIRPDTVFIPYHWPGISSANRLTHRTLDPRSKIPEFKVSACRIRRAEGPDPSPDDRGPLKSYESRGGA
jgi:predicted molibdopterin-dependent oxidoreductase YjgC